MAYPQVVRVFATTQKPDYDCPWQARRPSKATGSGVFIGPDQVLTGAHVVANATFLQLQKLSSPDKAVARVEAISHERDLALLTVDDPQFVADVQPAGLGQLPALRDKVSVVGYPVGGEEISITEGVVSRIEVQRYSHSQRHLLAVTVDAAINKGNSGGPVFKGGQVVGIAFQKLSRAENIGEMVPPPVIRTFLDGVRQGTPLDVPWLGLRTQGLENPSLRQRLGLAPEVSGVLVCAVEFGSSCWGTLLPGDTLLSIAGQSIANSGTIQYQGQFRTRFDAELCRFRVGEQLPLELLREGQRLSLQVQLKPACHLVPRNQYDRSPTYFVYGGLVFQPLSRNYLATWNKWWDKAPPEFLNHYYAGIRSEQRQEVVVLSQVLSDEINVGYEGLYYEAIEQIDGHTPRDMLDFVTRVERARGPVELRTSRAGVIVLDPARVRARAPQILERYHIPRDRSEDLPPPAGPPQGETDAG